MVHTAHIVTVNVVEVVLNSEAESSLVGGGGFRITALKR
jgi:hypothetical protein